MRLSGDQRRELQEALINAFPDKVSLEQMLALELDKNLDEIAGGTNLREVVFRLIRVAEANNWVEDLIDASRKSNPGNSRLEAIARELFSGSTPISLNYPHWDLLKEVKLQVASQLEQLLYNKVWINLRKESQPQEVLVSANIKIGPKPSESLPNSTTILEIFDREDIGGRLLILGKPGSGKTTTMTKLAKSLLERVEERQDYPIAVLFNLSSWKDERQPFIEWLRIELNSNYGIRTSKEFIKKWVKNQQLIPLLDGLDEVRPGLQESCINSINQFFQEYRPYHLVVSSRSEEYSNLSSQLSLNGAIYLKPLDNNQIYDYLSELNNSQLTQIINNNSSLLELVRTPFLLAITALSLQKISIDELNVLSSKEKRIKYLLNAYVLQMFSRNINNHSYNIVVADLAMLYSHLS